MSCSIDSCYVPCFECIPTLPTLRSLRGLITKNIEQNSTTFSL